MKIAVVGYVLVSQLLASHPLHGVLVQYDREIAALQSTQRLMGLANPAAAAQHGTVSLQRDAAVASAQAQRDGRRDASSDLARERMAIDAVSRSQRTSNAAVRSYTSQLGTATMTNVRAYGDAMETRTLRAYAARAAQLREKELTFAYDLERRDAGQRLLLQLRLTDLHLTPPSRAQYRSRLAAIDARELREVESLRRADAALLTAYREQLARQAAASADTMDAQFRSTASANYTILKRVFNESANALATFPLPSQVAALRESYAPSATARAIVTGMRSAGVDLAQRFTQAARVDAGAQRDVLQQLRSLQAGRAALLRTMLAQIKAEAQMQARAVHCAGVEFVNRAIAGTDLTAAVRSRLAREWQS